MSDMSEKMNAGFQYTYSAKEQEELKRIRNKYIPREEDKMEMVRRLDAQAYHRPTMYAIIAGVTGALVLGVGMCCCMVWGQSAFVFGLGVIAGLIGMGLAALAYPLYMRTLKRERERIAPEILRLTEDLMR